MPLTGQQSHIKEHAGYIKSRNWRITVTNYRSFSKNSGVKQVTYLIFIAFLWRNCKSKLIRILCMTEAEFLTSD